MSSKYEIDISNFSKDLDTYSEKIFNHFYDTSIENEIIKEKFEVESESCKNSEEGSSNNYFNERYNYNRKDIFSYKMIFEDTIKSLNYCINYLKMKEINTNEQFLIYFNNKVIKFMNYLMELTEYDNFKNLSYDSDNKKKIDLRKDSKINFLLVGKVKNDENENELYKKLLVQHYGSKSEMIPFDNMKKIKSILSANNIINDNIIFPNEIYN